MNDVYEQVAKIRKSKVISVARHATFDDLNRQVSVHSIIIINNNNNTGRIHFQTTHTKLMFNRADWIWYFRFYWLCWCCHFMISLCVPHSKNLSFLKSYHPKGWSLDIDMFQLKLQTQSNTLNSWLSIITRHHHWRQHRSWSPDSITLSIGRTYHLHDSKVCLVYPLWAMLCTATDVLMDVDLVLCDE